MNKAKNSRRPNGRRQYRKSYVSPLLCFRYRHKSRKNICECIHIWVCKLPCTPIRRPAYRKKSSYVVYVERCIVI